MSPASRLQRLRKDDEIERDVRAELDAAEGSRGHHLVRVVVEHGVVYLSGSVESYARKWALQRAVARVVGVRDVRDYLEVYASLDGHRDDSDLHTAARYVLAWDARVTSRVGVDVTDGVLRLYGTVERFAQRDAAEEAVRNLIGVRDIVNEIKVTPVAPLEATDDLSVDVEASIRRRVGVDDGCIAIGVDNGVVTLSGAVPALALLDAIEQAVRSTPGVTRIHNELLVA